MVTIFVFLYYFDHLLKLAIDHAIPYVITGHILCSKKNWTTKLMAVALSNLNRFSKFFRCETQ